MQRYIVHDFSTYYGLIDRQNIVNIHKYWYIFKWTTVVSIYDELNQIQIDKINLLLYVNGIKQNYQKKQSQRIFFDHWAKSM